MHIFNGRTISTSSIIKALSISMLFDLASEETDDVTEFAMHLGWTLVSPLHQTKGLDTCCWTSRKEICIMCSLQTLLHLSTSKRYTQQFLCSQGPRCVGLCSVSSCPGLEIKRWFPWRVSQSTITLSALNRLPSEWAKVRAISKLKRYWKKGTNCRHWKA